MARITDVYICVRRIEKQKGPFLVEGSWYEIRKIRVYLEQWKDVERILSLIKNLSSRLNIGYPLQRSYHRTHRIAMHNKRAPGRQK